MLDRSGSMSGEKIKQAQEAAVQVVAGLDDGEAFNLIIYNDSIQRFANEPVIKSADIETQAHSYIRATSAGHAPTCTAPCNEALAQSPRRGCCPSCCS